MDTTFEQMSPAERLLYVQDLWDRIAEHPEDVPVSDEMKAELDQRLAEHRADPSSAIPWETVKARLRALDRCAQSAANSEPIVSGG